MKISGAVSAGTDQSTGIAIPEGVPPLRPDALHDVLFRVASVVNQFSRQGKAVVTLSAGK